MRYLSPRGQRTIGFILAMTLIVGAVVGVLDLFGVIKL